ncbi:16648_t:CDS:2, partial [Racocetra persica]
EELTPKFYCLTCAAVKYKEIGIELNNFSSETILGYGGIGISGSMGRKAKLTIGYDGLDLPCQGCYELDPQITNYQAIHLIVSEKNKEGVYPNPFFYCGGCVYSVLEEMKIEAFNIGLPREKNRKIYKLT